MNAALALVDNGEALPGLLREDGYVLPPALPFERWCNIVSTLQTMQRSVSWWAGDALLYGEQHYGEDAYQAVQDATGRGDDSLRQAAWVASKYPPATRVATLSWSHHRVAAELEPETRSALLREAAAANLSTRELIARVKAEQEKARAVPAEAAPVCQADAEPPAWVPGPDDLTEEASARMRFEMTMRGVKDAGAFGAGWCAALAFVEALDCFARDE